MKNSGMMKPPGQPDDTVSDVPSSFATTATARTLTPSRVLSTWPVWASPKVSAYGDQIASSASAEPTDDGPRRGGNDAEHRDAVRA